MNSNEYLTPKLAEGLTPKNSHCAMCPVFLRDSLFKGCSLEWPKLFNLSEGRIQKPQIFDRRAVPKKKRTN